MSYHRNNNTDFDNLCGSPKTFQKNETLQSDIVAATVAVVAVAAAAATAACIGLKRLPPHILLIHYMKTACRASILRPKDSGMDTYKQDGGYACQK